MRYICFLLIASLILVLSGSVQAAGVIEVTAFQGKATDWRSADIVVGNTTQLMTRNGTWPDCKKSWLQFDLTSVYAENTTLQGHITDAKLTFYGAKQESSAKSYVVNGLNDDAGLEDWIASELTWNNGPGNDPNSGTDLNTSLTTNLYSNSIPIPQLDVMSETPEEDRADLVDYLNADTDGMVTFILTPGSTCYVWNVGEPLEPVLTLTYELGQDVTKAHDPIPSDGEQVGLDLASLSWTNPEPNAPGGTITCDVYLGTEPNKAPGAMDVVSLGAGVSTVDLTSFPNYGDLDNMTTYYWIVDVHDTSSLNVISGEEWSFEVNTNSAPIVSAGDDQAVWLGKSGTPDQEEVTLNGSTSDDGAYTVQWTQVDNGAPDVTISPDNTDVVTVTITERGEYEFMLTANDGIAEPVSDNVTVIVGDDSCDASHMDTGDDYNVADENQDCIVDMLDLVTLILEDWLNCTDDITDCN